MAFTQLKHTDEVFSQILALSHEGYILKIINMVGESEHRNTWTCWYIKYMTASCFLCTGMIRT